MRESSSIENYDSSMFDGLFCLFYFFPKKQKSTETNRDVYFLTMHFLWC